MEGPCPDESIRDDPDVKLEPNSKSLPALPRVGVLGILYVPAGGIGESCKLEEWKNGASNDR